jgi:hypothetical protein
LSASDKYSACFNRFGSQLLILHKYLTLVVPVIKEVDIAEFTFESFLLRLSCYIEEFLGCIIVITSVYKENMLREYFEKNRSDKTKETLLIGCNLRTLIDLGKKELSFKKDAKKFERLFKHLFGGSPFPDKKTKDYISDMVLVRNIIVHDGGMPNENHAKQIRSPNVINKSYQIDSPQLKVVFYKLDLTDIIFINDLMPSVFEMISHIEKILN